MYTTLTELLKNEIFFIKEYKGYYYVKLKKEQKDDVISKVDKITGNAQYISLVIYFVEAADDAIDVDPDRIRRELENGSLTFDK